MEEKIEQPMSFEGALLMVLQESTLNMEAAADRMLFIGMSQAALQLRMQAMRNRQLIGGAAEA